jgi:VCBS repeat-containing protein
MNNSGPSSAPARGLQTSGRSAPDSLPKKRKGPGADEALAQDGLLAADGVAVAEAGPAAAAEGAAGEGASTAGVGANGTVVTGVDSIGVSSPGTPNWFVTLGIWAGVGGAVGLSNGGGGGGGAANAAPTAANGSISASENDSSITGQAVGLDANGGTLTFSVVGPTPAGLTFNADGSFSYVPQAVDHAMVVGESRDISFNYVVSDGSLTSSPATITITLAGANDAPAAAAVALVGSEDDAEILGSVSASDAEGDSVSYSLVGPLPAGLEAGLTPGGDFNGTFSYTPTPGDGVAGPGGTRIVTFQYVANDGTADSAPATVTITLNGPNDAPVAAAATARGSENDAGITGSVSGTDADGHALTYSLVNAAPAGLTFNADGTFTYVPQLIDNGLDAQETRVFTFDYVANDGHVDSAPATVTVTVTGSNDNPVSGGATAVSVSEDATSITGDLPVGSDPDDEPLQYFGIGSAPTGVTVDNATGKFTYVLQPGDQALDSGETSTVPITFQYVVHDGTGFSEPATVTITVTGVNDAPVVAGTAARTVSASTSLVTGAVSATDVDGETLSYAISGATPAGLTFNANGTYTYAMQADDLALDVGESRPVTFVYVASDGDASSGQCTVTITVNGANDAPVTGGDVPFSGSEDDGSIAGSVTATDVDGEAVTFSVSGATPAGLTFNSDGTFIYVMQAEDEALNTGESRDVTFDYVANDGTIDSTVATVTLTILGADETFG